MGNTVYTRERIRAIVEETRLNGDPESNLPLYDSVRQARVILCSSISQPFEPQYIQNLEDQLAGYERSYAARFYREELLKYEARNIADAKDVFELDRVARLIKDLGEYQNPEALQHRTQLDDLWSLAQSARGYIQNQLSLDHPQVTVLLTNLEPYTSRSAEISGIYQRLQRKQQNLENQLGIVA